MDRSIRGWKRLMKTDPENTTERVNRIIRNTYRTLMTRGMKGCFVYCVDPALGEYFKRRLATSPPEPGRAGLPSPALPGKARAG